MSVEVVGLYTYPVKSCGAISHEQIDVTPNGLEHDRWFMLIDEDGKFISQRQEPALALVQPHIDTSRRQSLALTAPGMEDVETWLHSRPEAHRAVRADLHGKTVEGQDGPTEISEWFSRYLGKAVWFIATDPEKPRSIDLDRAENGFSRTVGFADAFSILLASMASLRDFSERSGLPLDISRFRPNIVIDGPDLEPYDEDAWQKIKTGRQVARILGPCKRCVTINVDQASGEVNEQVLRSLAAVRGGKDITLPPGAKGANGAFFGQNLQHAYSGNPKVIQLGYKLRPTSKNTHPNVRLKAA